MTNTGFYLADTHELMFFFQAHPPQQESSLQLVQFLLRMNILLHGALSISSSMILTFTLLTSLEMEQRPSLMLEMLFSPIFHSTV